MRFDNFTSFVYDDHADIPMEDFNFMIEREKDTLPFTTVRSYSDDVKRIARALSEVPMGITAKPKYGKHYVMGSIHVRSVGDVRKSYVELELLCESIFSAFDPAYIDHDRNNILRIPLSSKYTGMSEIAIHYPTPRRLDEENFAISHLVSTAKG